MFTRLRGKLLPQTIQSQYVRESAAPFLFHFLTVYNTVALLLFAPVLLSGQWLAYCVPALVLSGVTFLAQRRARG